MKSASRNYFLGTLVKTPLKVYFTGSSAHVALKETMFLLSLALRTPNLQKGEVLSAMVAKAVLIYVPAHRPATVVLNFLLGIGVLVLWTVRYDRATNF